MVFINFVYPSLPVSSFTWDFSPSLLSSLLNDLHKWYSLPSAPRRAAPPRLPIHPLLIFFPFAQRQPRSLWSRLKAGHKALWVDDEKETLGILSYVSLFILLNEEAERSPNFTALTALWSCLVCCFFSPDFGGLKGSVFQLFNVQQIKAWHSENMVPFLVTPFSFSAMKHFDLILIKVELSEKGNSTTGFINTSSWLRFPWLQSSSDTSSKGCAGEEP